MVADEIDVVEQEEDNDFDNYELHKQVEAFEEDDDDEVTEYEHGLSIDSIDQLVFDIDFNETLKSLILQNYNQISNETDLVFSDVAYFYLRDELGISEEMMWKITFHAGNILGLKPSLLRSKVKLLQETLDLTISEVRDVVQRQPATLGLSIEQNLKTTIEFLCRELDLDPKSHLKTLVLASPAILSYSISNLAAKVHFFTTTLGFSVHEARTLCLALPKLLCCGLESGLLPRFKFWKREMRIPLDQLRKIFQKNPRLLTYSLNNNLRPKLIFYLIMTLHMEPRQVLKLLLTFPKFLDYSLEEHLLPITRYFISELQYSSLEFRNLVIKCPRVMSSALFKIKHVAGYFRYELGMEASDVKRVLYQAPQVIGLSDVNLRSKVEFVRTTFALDEAELRQVLASVPTLLQCGVEQNLQPKMDYLRDVFDKYHRGELVDGKDHHTGDDDDTKSTRSVERLASGGDGSAQLRQVFLKLPTLLVYSLDKRIRPRLELLLEAGISPSKISVGIPMKQANFETWLQRHGERLDRQLHNNAAAAASVDMPAIVANSSNDGRIVQWTRQRQRI